MAQTRQNTTTIWERYSQDSKTQASLWIVRNVNLTRQSLSSLVSSFPRVVFQQIDPSIPNGFISPSIHSSESWHFRPENPQYHNPQNHNLGTIHMTTKAHIYIYWSALYQNYDEGLILYERVGRGGKSALTWPDGAYWLRASSGIGQYFEYPFFLPFESEPAPVTHFTFLKTGGLLHNHCLQERIIKTIESAWYKCLIVSSFHIFILTT